LVPKGASADQGAVDDNNYNMVPTKTTKTPWGVSLSEATNGATEAVALRLIAENPPIIEAWATDAGSVLTTSFTPISVAKTDVFNANGTALTVSSVDTGNKTITLSGSAETAVYGVYETSDKI
jgi:hypothetical protein